MRNAAWRRAAATALALVLAEGAPAGADSPLSPAEDRVALAPHVDDLRGEEPGPAAFAIASEYPVGQGRFRLVWEEDALWVSVAVEDDVRTASRAQHDQDGTWLEDGVEVVIDRMPGQPDELSSTVNHVIVSAAGGVLDAQGFAVPPDVTPEFASARVEGSGADFTVLIRLDLAAMGVAEPEGAVLGLDLMVNDADGTTYTTRDWMGLDTYGRPACYGRLLLVGPGAPSECLDGFGREGEGCVKEAGCQVAPGRARLLSDGVVLVLVFAISRRVAGRRCSR